MSISLLRKQYAGDSAHHQQHQHHHNASRQALRTGFLLTLAILVVEVIGGVFAHSLALFSDAAHVLTDIIALGVAWFAAAQAERPANERRTFGYHRMGILSALGNGLTLLVIAGVIIYEAWQRLHTSIGVEPGIMLLAAGFALLINVYVARTLHGGHTHEDNLNVRAAALHVLGDIGASAGVILGAGIIALTGAQWVDPLLSVAIAVLIAIPSLRLIRETVSILMESTPKGLPMAQLAEDMSKAPGVIGVHDLHVWTIASGMHALSSHVVINDIPPSESAGIMDNLAGILRNRYGICHTTIQFESTKHDRHADCACQCSDADRLYCDLRTQASHEGHTH